MKSPHSIILFHQKQVRRFYDEKKEDGFVKNVREEKKKYSWDNLIDNIEQLVG